MRRLAVQAGGACKECELFCQPCSIAVAAATNLFLSGHTAELVIGNIVRRVMHIIREEMEADGDDKEDELEAVPERERPVGGLSKAFRLE
jgi:hypothetical protein